MDGGAPPESGLLSLLGLLHLRLRSSAHDRGPLKSPNLSDLCSPLSLLSRRASATSSTSSGSLSVASGGSSPSAAVASSLHANALPLGNICPSRKICKAGMATRTPMRSDVLGSGTENYGHDSIVRGGAGGGAAGDLGGKRGMNPLEVMRMGNEHYKKGEYREVLGFYDWAVAT